MNIKNSSYIRDDSGYFIQNSSYCRHLPFVINEDNYTLVRNP